MRNAVVASRSFDMSNPRELEALQRRRRSFEDCLRDERVRAASLAQTDWYDTRPRVATCPCCAYPTLAERATREICIVCNWQDEGLDDETADRRVKANGRYSLNEARGNFLAFGHQFLPINKISFERMGLIAPIRRRFVSIFDTLLPNVEPERYVRALPSIKDCYRFDYRFRFGDAYPGDLDESTWRAGRAAFEAMMPATLRPALTIVHRSSDSKYDDRASNVATQ